MSGERRRCCDLLPGHDGRHDWIGGGAPRGCTCGHPGVGCYCPVGDAEEVADLNNEPAADQ